MPLLADLDLQELLRLGFVALLVGGSMIGGIVKNLRDKRERRAQETPAPKESGPRTIPTERARPDATGAQPVPNRSRRAQGPPTTPPPAQAWPSRPASAQPRAAGFDPYGHPQQAPSAPSPRSRPVRAPLVQRDRQAPEGRPAAPVARPVTRPPHPPRELQPEAAGVSPRRVPKPVAKRKASSTTVGKLDKPKRKSLRQKMRARDTAAEPAIVAQEIGDEIDTIRHPTRTSLRRAILLNEVLSLPLALRPPEEG